MDPRLSYSSQRRPSFPLHQTHLKAGVAHAVPCDGDSLDIANSKVQLEALRRWMLEGGAQGRFARLDDACAIAALPVVDDELRAPTNPGSHRASRSLQDDVASAVYLLGGRCVPRLR
jgi:hypothetical protein